MLDITTSLRVYLKEENRLQKGKYKLRQTVYVFICVDCQISEIEVHAYDLKKVSGRCRACADKNSAKHRGVGFRKRPYEALYNKFCYDRRRDCKESSLTYADFCDFARSKSCHYCTREVFWSEYSLGTNGYSYNLDRKDNSKGYSVKNCVVCCWLCNETKGARYSYDEFMLVAPALRVISMQRKQAA